MSFTIFRNAVLKYQERVVYIGLYIKEKKFFFKNSLKEIKENVNYYRYRIACKENAKKR